jgi:hypothetical protein
VTGPASIRSGYTTTTATSLGSSLLPGATTSSTPTPGAASKGSSPAAPSPQTTENSGETTQQEITNAYEAYLVDLSGLDDTLSKSYLSPLASVTTNRLAQATVRQAAAILNAQEHGVGTLRDDHVAITMSGNASAALADCQDEDDFYLVSDDSDTPDTFVARGDFVGSAQLVLQDGHWLVDTFTTTHVTCTF